MGIASKIVKGGLEAVAKKARRAEDLERKAAEAYAQMPEYLQDPYLGLSTSNIGKVTKSVLAKAPRMSKTELEASGFYHPIGRGLKLSKPAQEYTANIVADPDMPLVPKKIVSPEDLYGKVGIPLVGDRSETGKLLRGIEGVTFDKPVRLEGGHKFGRAHQYKDPKASSVWASDSGVVTALNNQIRRAAESGKDVLGVSSIGSPEMVDFNTMIAQSALNMTDLGGIHPKAIEAFNDEIKNLAKKNKQTGKVTAPFQNFLGIDHPEVTTQLLSKNAGELRKAFIRTMEKDEYRKLGFPELAPIRKAIINPEILDMPLGSTGLDIYKMSPKGSIVEAPKNPHSTYPVHMQGEYFGGLEEPIDYKNMFSTFYEPKRLLSVPDQHAYRAYSLSAPIQEFNQQWLDEVMPIYQQKIKDITGRKKGGSVEKDPEQIRDMIKSILGSDIQKAEGGAIADDAEEYGEQLKEQRKTLGSDILKSGAKGITEGVGNILRSAKETLSRAGTLGDIAKIPVDPLLGKMQYEAVTGKKFPELKPISLLPEQSITESPVGAKILPFTTEGQQFAGEVLGDPLSYSVSGAGRGIKKVGKFIGKGLAEAEATGKGPVGKIMQTIVPRMNILPERGVNLGVDFFRPSEDTIRGHKMDTMPGSQWYSWLQSNAPKSSKKELEASGTINWLKDSQEKISKNDIINHLRENEPNLRSKTYSSYETHPYEVIGDAESGNYDVVDSSMGDTIISSHGDQGDAYMAMDELANEMYPMTKYKQYTLPGGEEYREIVIQDKPKVWSKNKNFESSHYPEATNPIAHLRVNHRDDADGNPTLFIEELQSDWGQKGKKEGFGQKQLPTDMSAEDLLNNYRDNLSYSQKAWLNRFIGQWESVDAYNNVPNQTQKLDELTDLYQNWVKSQEFGVPRNPYVEDTKDWTALALKQAIKEAVDNGKTQVAWTTGAQQAERYDLSKHLSSVSLRPAYKGDKLELQAIDHDGKAIINNKLVTPEELEDHIGKDLANKLINTPTGGDSNIRRLEGLDIKVGGEGMQGYYDKIVPQVANDVIKQLGGKNKVKTIKISQGEPTYALRNKTTGNDIGGGYTYKEALQQVKDNPNREMYLVEGGDSDQLGFEITPDMIKFIKEDAGIPKFKKGGSIDLQQEYKLENMRRRYG
jgi:hypothetical protein